MITISSEQFCMTVESINSRLSLTNSDGYLKSQWQFTNREDATFFHGATAALSTFIIVDSKVGSHSIAPIVRDDDGNLFADLTRIINVFSDEIEKI